MKFEDALNHFQDVPPPASGPHHIPGQDFDVPALTEDVRNLYTLSYAQAISAISDVMFPPRMQITKSGRKYNLVASDAGIERYFWFRAAWQPDEFGLPLQLALRDLTAASLASYSGRHFVLLQHAEGAELLKKLELGELPSESWPSSRCQKNTFSILHEAFREGFLAEPGYGGNRNGIGWYYANLMEIPL